MLKTSSGRKAWDAMVASHNIISNQLKVTTIENLPDNFYNMAIVGVKDGAGDARALLTTLGKVLTDHPHYLSQEKIGEEGKYFFRI